MNLRRSLTVRLRFSCSRATHKAPYLEGQRRHTPGAEEARAEAMLCYGDLAKEISFSLG